jgi:hypothetical protein
MSDSAGEMDLIRRGEEGVGMEDDVGVGVEGGGEGGRGRGCGEE